MLDADLRLEDRRFCLVQRRWDCDAKRIRRSHSILERRHGNRPERLYLYWTAEPKTQDAMRFLERNTRTAYRIEWLRRENVPEYPMKALREAITNAVMHRDWSVEGANVFVEIYTDRIEVVSPGGLPNGMPLADLGCKSIRRNALIADLLHRIDFIEKAGTGIKRIRDEVREQGYAAAVQQVIGGSSVFRKVIKVAASPMTRRKVIKVAASPMSKVIKVAASPMIDTEEMAGSPMNCGSIRRSCGRFRMPS